MFTGSFWCLKRDGLGPALDFASDIPNHHFLRVESSPLPKKTTTFEGYPLEI
jgi:hypothetical protein